MICHQKWRWMLLDVFFLYGFTSVTLLNRLGPTVGPLIELETRHSCSEPWRLLMGQHWRRQTMLAAIKMEVMTPTVEAPDEGCIAIDFHMPPICSPLVRPGRPAEIAPILAKQLSDSILSSSMIDLKELCLVNGKAAWMAYLDIYCLDADGALFDAALLSAVAAFSHLQIPIVSLNDDGRVVLVSEDSKGRATKQREPVNKGKRKLRLNVVPFALTCVLYKDYILADPTSEEESIMETCLTVVLNSSFQLVSFNKPGGPGLAHASAIQDCISLTRQRVKELEKILNEAISDMEVD